MNLNAFPGYVLPSTTIAVDFFPTSNHDHLTHFFLTHAHTDHTKNLSSSWYNGTIYCSSLTKRLIMHWFNIQPEFVNDLELNQTYMFKLDDSESFNVTLIDANHCPGAVMFLFEGYFGCYLATGDFRFDKNLIENSAIMSKQIDVCFIDNTYFNPAFASIPCRQEAEEMLIRTITEALENDCVVELKMKNLGKELLLDYLSDHFNTKICVSEARFFTLTKILKLDEDHFANRFDEKTTLIYVQDKETEQLRNKITQEYGKKIVQIEPTALYLATGRSQNRFGSHVYIPYSDHSSYSELIEFAKLIRPKRFVPIVRKPLPKGIDTTDLSELDKYLNREPLIECYEKYKLLLQSKKRRSNRLASFKLNAARQQQPSRIQNQNENLTTRRFIVMNKPCNSNRNKSSKTQIEYETPTKGSQQQSSETKLSANIFYSTKRKAQSLEPKSSHNSELEAVKIKQETFLPSDISEMNDQENKIQQTKKRSVHFILQRPTPEEISSVFQNENEIQNETDTSNVEQPIPKKIKQEPLDMVMDYEETLMKKTQPSVDHDHDDHAGHVDQQRRENLLLKKRSMPIKSDEKPLFNSLNKHLKRLLRIDNINKESPSENCKHIRKYLFDSFDF